MTSQAEKESTVVGNAVRVSMQVIWISLGANIHGRWGEPEASLLAAICKLEEFGLRVVASSPLYSTPALGNVRQPRYLNMVIGVIGSLGSLKLLHVIKRLEVAAGRRKRGQWGPRPLDLDILDHGGRIIGRPSRRRIEGQLILPHPEMHMRGFVLVPLATICRAWRHPRLDMSARQLLARHPILGRGIRRLPTFAGQRVGRQA